MDNMFKIENITKKTSNSIYDKVWKCQNFSSG